MRANWRRSAYSAVLLVSLFSLVVIADEQIRVSNAIVDGNRLVVAFYFKTSVLLVDVWQFFYQYEPE